MKTYCFKFTVVGFIILLVSPITSVVATEEWQADEAISGLGDVTMTNPNATVEYRENLHCDLGFTGPETAWFELDVTNAEDIDKCLVNGEYIYEDAGLDEASTLWDCGGASIGDIDDGAFDTVFTPSDTPYADIEIACMVFEGHEKSYADGNCDPNSGWIVSATTVNTFRVGVEMNWNVFPGERLYEDDSGVLGVSMPVSNLEKEIEPTGLLATPGAETQDGACSQLITWKAVAVTEDDEDIDGVMSGIDLDLDAVGTGKIRSGGMCGGMSQGNIGAIVTTIAGLYNPWLGITIGIAFMAAESPERTNARYTFLARSQIEGVGGQNLGDENEHVITSTVDHNDFTLSTLDIVAEIGPLDVGEEVRSAALLKTKIRTYDDEPTSETGAYSTLLESPTFVLQGSDPRYW